MTGSDAATLVTAGDRALARGDLAAAADAYRAALEAEADSLPALLGSSRIALLGGHPLEARVLLTRLLALAPRHPVGLALMAAERLEAGDAGSALDWATDARAADTRCALAWGVAAKAHLALGEADLAAAAATRAIELEPHDFESRLTLGTIAAERGRGEEAVDHLVAALEAEPRCLPAYVLLGEVFTGVGRVDLARRLYEEGTRHLPRVEMLRERLAALSHG